MKTKIPIKIKKNEGKLNKTTKGKNTDMITIHEKKFKVKEQNENKNNYKKQEKN